MGQFWPPVAADTGWVTVTTFENGWSADAGWGPVQVRRIGKQVFWRGQLVGGSASAALTIPAGFRPEVVDVYWAAITDGSDTVTRLAVHGASPTKLSARVGTSPNLAAVSYLTGWT